MTEPPADLAERLHLTEESLRAGSYDDATISGPGPGWWVAIVLLGGWATLAADIWARRRTDPYPAATALGR